jgi:hypothetical protein
MEDKKFKNNVMSSEKYRQAKMASKLGKRKGGKKKKK